MEDVAIQPLYICMVSSVFQVMISKLLDSCGFVSKYFNSEDKTT